MRPGIQAPPMVCLQFAIDEEHPPELIHVQDPACKRWVQWALESADVLDGHHVAFDTVVLCAQYPDLMELVFEAYEQNRITCTKLRQKLIAIAEGWFDGEDKNFGLDACSKRMTGMELDKSDPWRLKYGILYNVPASHWPEAAKRYALLDATAQRALYYAQTGYTRHSMRGYLRDEYRQARAGFWLRLMETRGIRTGLDAVKKYHEKVLESLERDRAIATEAGLVRADGTRDTKAAMARMVEVMLAREEEPLLTDTGLEKRHECLRDKGYVLSAAEMWSEFNSYIKLDEDACLLSGDDVLKAYQRYSSSQTTLARVERLYFGVDLPLQPQYQPLIATGRTSCRMGEVKPGESPIAWGFQMQNPPRKEGIRECFVPRPGYLFCSVDYNSKEMCAWAQVCLWALKESRLAKVINDGLDPHTELGATLAGLQKPDAYRILKGEFGPERKKAFKSGERQLAKVSNFGFMGGMGAETFRLQARTGYDIDIAIQEAKRLRYAWLQEWPEAQKYFDWIDSQMHGETWENRRATITHFLSNRVRADITFTVACNSYFQGLSSDSAKCAGFQLAKEAYVVSSSDFYGCRPVVFLHDEFIAEVPDHPERAHFAAHRMARIMVEEAQKWIPDVAIRAEPALMRRWYKNAEAVYDANGLLIPWEPARSEAIDGDLTRSDSSGRALALAHS